MTDRQIRKPLRLKEYDYSSPGAYFVTLCAVNKQKIFGNIKTVGADAHIGPQVVLTDLGFLAEKYIKSIPGIDKYIIMPNHIHMIVKIEHPGESGPMWASAPTLSDLIRSYKTLVSKAAGNTVFQRSFYDHVIRDDNDYLRIWKYIDENPAKWVDDELFIP